VKRLVEIPKTEIVPLDKLKVDGQNPNKMTEQQLRALTASVLRWGFIVPIITNKDCVIADGEQRYTVARQVGMAEIPVIHLDVDDVDRRLIRQVMNKLRGEHELVADAMEFERIIQEGHEKDLKALLALSDNQVDRVLKSLRGDERETGLELTSIYEVVVECADEKEQEQTYNKLVQEGYKCRVLIL
jgi:ParB-like chromosome segregation protein Spo0J